MIHKKSFNRFYPIPGFTGYFINKKTTDILCTNEHLPVILDQIPNSKGRDNYFIVVLSDNKNHFVHRLMAKTFLSGPEKEHVNHIDGNKQNNIITNLEWSTPKENAQHAYSTGLSDNVSLYKEVHRYQLDGLYIDSFVSDTEANTLTGVAKENISKCTLGKRDYAGGYQWRRTKLSRIAPIDAVIWKSTKLLNNVTNEEIEVLPIKQDMFSPIIDVVKAKKHILTTRFAKSDVIFVNDYRIEKVYFK